MVFWCSLKYTFDDMYDAGVKCTYTVKNLLAGIYSVKNIISDIGIQGLKAIRVEKSENN